MDVGKGINLKYAATLAGITHKKLMQLNSAYSDNKKNQQAYRIILPIENVQQFSENLSQSPKASHSINWQHYRVKSGDTLASIANKFDVNIGELRKLNQLSNNNIKKGINLIIPATPSDDKDDESEVTERDANRNEYIAQHREDRPIIKKQKPFYEKLTNDLQMVASKKEYKLEPGDTIYMVRKEDTLASIAKKFQISQFSILSANRMAENTLRAGRQIIIPTHNLMPEKNSNQKMNIQPNDTIYMVRRGETIEKISKKFHTTASAIRVANLLKSNDVREGERLLIPHS